MTWSGWWSAGRRRVRAIRPVTILSSAGLLAVLYGFPGYMNYDAASQLAQARSGHYDDWHPPFMAAYWRRLDEVIAGPLPLLVIQIALTLWGLRVLLERRFAPRPAALLAALVLLFPPILAPMGAVWKDAQMVGWLLGGIGLALSPSWRARLGGIALLVIAAAVRDNATCALPPFALVIAAAWGVRRPLAICATGFAIWLAITSGGLLANAATRPGHAHAWAKANAIHDIAGTICFSPPMTDDEIRTALAGVALRQHDDLQHRFCTQYNPDWWFPLSFNELGLFVTDPGADEIAARRAAYFRVVRAHPWAFLHHRWLVTKDLLGLASTPGEPVCQTPVGAPFQSPGIHHDISLSFLQRVVGRKFLELSQTLLFRPYAYALVALVLGLYAAFKRDGLVVAIVSSGLLYELSFTLGAAGNPYRYSHWMVLCTSLATAIVFCERWRAGRRATA